MNFVEFINQKGVCKTAAGHKIHDLRVIDWDTNHPLIGFIERPNSHLSHLQWNLQGIHTKPLHKPRSAPNRS